MDFSFQIKNSPHSVNKNGKPEDNCGTDGVVGGVVSVSDVSLGIEVDVDEGVVEVVDASVVGVVVIWLVGGEYAKIASVYSSIMNEKSVVCEVTRTF